MRIFIWARTQKMFNKDAEYMTEAFSLCQKINYANSLTSTGSPYMNAARECYAYYDDRDKVTDYTSLHNTLLNAVHKLVEDCKDSIEPYYQYLELLKSDELFPCLDDFKRKNEFWTRLINLEKRLSSRRCFSRAVCFQHADRVWGNLCKEWAEIFTLVVPSEGIKSGLASHFSE